jgi:hypothetical protein
VQVLANQVRHLSRSSLGINDGHFTIQRERVRGTEWIDTCFLRRIKLVVGKPLWYLRDYTTAPRLAGSTAAFHRVPQSLGRCIPQSQDLIRFPGNMRTSVIHRVSCRISLWVIEIAVCVPVLEVGGQSLVHYSILRHTTVKLGSNIVRSSHGNHNSWFIKISLSHHHFSDFRSSYIFESTKTTSLATFEDRKTISPPRCGRYPDGQQYIHSLPCKMRQICIVYEKPHSTWGTRGILDILLHNSLLAACKYDYVS